MIRRHRPMTEAECYARCYGGPARIQVVRLPRTGSGPLGAVSGEQLRRQFERRLDSREREAA